MNGCPQYYTSSSSVVTDNTDSTICTIYRESPTSRTTSNTDQDACTRSFHFSEYRNEHKRYQETPRMGNLISRTTCATSTGKWHRSYGKADSWTPNNAWTTKTVRRTAKRLLDRRAEVILVRFSLIPDELRDQIKRIKRQTAAEQPLPLDDLIKLHLRLGYPNTQIWFGVAPTIAVDILLGKSYINLFYLKSPPPPPWTKNCTTALSTRHNS